MEGSGSTEGEFRSNLISFWNKFSVFDRYVTSLFDQIDDDYDDVEEDQINAYNN